MKTMRPERARSSPRGSGTKTPRFLATCVAAAALIFSGCTLQLGPKSLPARPAIEAGTPPTHEPAASQPTDGMPDVPQARGTETAGMFEDLAGRADFWTAVGLLLAAVGGVYVERKRRTAKARRQEG